MNNQIHQEPVIVDIGFKPNKRGGWWYREPQNRYTVQIIPARKERRGWMLGIAHRGPMRWGKHTYPAPEAAAFTALRYVADTALCDKLSERMQNKAEEHTRERKTNIKRVINRYMERSYARS
ncbi:MAG: hypothetical protein OXT74_02725 [Candidatus Poribacteria bacterium]|nr:hypothetical protein [Candidatus Poribacteria bacterium]